jgi:broad specificity phosphatase PhoE
MMISEDPQSEILGNHISSITEVTASVTTDRLCNASFGETYDDVCIRMQAVVNVIRDLGVSRAAIISHHSVLKIWRPELDLDSNWKMIEV